MTSNHIASSLNQPKTKQLKNSVSPIYLYRSTKIYILGYGLVAILFLLSCYLWLSAVTLIDRIIAISAVFATVFLAVLCRAQQKYKDLPYYIIDAHGITRHKPALKQCELEYYSWQNTIALLKQDNHATEFVTQELRLRLKSGQVVLLPLVMLQRQIGNKKVDISSDEALVYFQQAYKNRV